MLDKYFGDIGQNAGLWFSNPMKIVALCLFIVGFAILLLAPKINILINKKKKGNYILFAKITGWIIAVLATFLAII